LASRAKIGDHEFIQKPGLDFDHSLGSVLCVQHRDVVDVQAQLNTIAAEIVVRVGLRPSEFEREQVGFNIVVAKSWCLFEAVKCFL